ncbi:STAS domain-containing protein [Variovorax dokdonensis]|uniref:STAS domain-containing protein n=1 Tax=Variovorax dokdonensis TaxID=344883 RepID=A0ABT7NBA8_9BURK|nr:STAS domain-containing protein [Variovorax dokdonensis]MDM0045238.1 STAS domain-containing protein [Variovorax dokdonensis]
MGKEETGGRLLSKVAKFVRNPLKDWSELDAGDSASPEAGYSREMLKEMIERRQRNDFVRRREFDMLRKLRQREAAGGGAEADGVAAVSSSFNVTSDKTEGRALTLKKIDEIEEQMSQQWWKGRAGEAAVPPAADAAVPQNGSDVSPAYAETQPGVPPPSKQVEAALAEEAPVGRMSPAPVGLEDAAIRFAQSDDVGAEKVLLQMTSIDGAQAEDAEVWRTLLDFYRVTGDAEKFSAASMRFAQRLRRPGPEWVSLRQLAHDAQAARAQASESQPAPLAVAGRPADWSSPAQLRRENLAELTRALGAAGPVWTMDWRGLTQIEPDTVAPLRALFNHWAESPVQLRFLGAGRLLDVLAKATPVGNRNMDVMWWQLRLAVLRATHESDQYELAALNYCITYEVSPPPWADPRGSFTAVDAPEPPPLPALEEAGRSQQGLIGNVSGDCQSELQRLDAAMARSGSTLVSCAALLRVDLEAARTLIDWVAQHEMSGRRVEFVDAHRLVATFLQVVGVTDHADVSLRAK